MEKYLPQLIITAFTLLSTVVIRVVILSLIRRFASVNSKIESRTNYISRICSIILNSVCLLILVIVWGVDPKNLFIAVSSIFAVIGVALFAQWSILSNVTAGIIIFFTSPFKIGDTIRLIDKDFPYEAKVEDIFAFYTHLKTKDGELHVFPNALLLQKGISVMENKLE